MSESFLMSDQDLLALAKGGTKLDEQAKLQEFFQLWFDIEEYVDELFTCLRKSNFYSDHNTISSKAQRQEILETASTLRKSKFIDDPAIPEATCITIMRD